MKKITKEHIEEIRQVKARMEEAEEAAFEVCKARGYGHAACREYLSKAEKEAAWELGYSVGYVRKILKIAARRERLHNIMKEATNLVRTKCYNKSEALRIAWGGTRQPVKLLELPEVIRIALGDIAVTFDEAKSLTPVTMRKTNRGVIYKMGEGFAKIAYDCIRSVLISCTDIEEHFNTKGELDGLMIYNAAKVNPRFAISEVYARNVIRGAIYRYIRAWYPMARWSNMYERLYV